MEFNINDDIVNLAEEILEDIELSKLEMGPICLKASKLARMQNHDKAIKLLQTYSEQCAKNEAMYEAAKLQMTQASDNRTTGLNSGYLERNGLNTQIQNAQGNIASFKKTVYEYVLTVLHTKKFSGHLKDIFDEKRKYIDQEIGNVIPGGAELLKSIDEGLDSPNAVTITNTVHTCRKLLIELADTLIPYNAGRPSKVVGEKTVLLGKKNYINRLIDFIGTKSNSNSYGYVIGTNLEYVGNLIDGIVDSSNKGSHVIILPKEQAEMYVIYTYLLIGNLLKLNTEKTTA